MATIIKKGIGVILVYFIAILCTFLVTNRVNELEHNDLRNNNSSISIKFSR